jgi:hypothetical protein
VRAASRRTHPARDGFDHTIFGFLQESNDLAAGHGWKSFEEIVDRFACFDIIEQRLHRDTGAWKDRRPAHDFRIA